MQDYIQIAQLNDFVFCPRSIFFHNLYLKYSDQFYKYLDQVAGTMVHSSVDKHTFSTRKQILQGLPVFSEKYGLVGKIDTFDVTKGELVERKKRIKKIYDGYKYQLWAQMFCLREMGYDVKKIYFYSIDDNKKIAVKKPTKKDVVKFSEIVNAIYNFDLHADFKANPKKCVKCIYRELCDYNPLN